MLANGQGWTPRAEVLEFRDENTRQHITLTDQLTLSGTVSRDGAPIGGRPGRPERGDRRGGRGRSEPTMPAATACRCRRAGRYIVTMLEPDTLHAHARKVVLDVRSAVVDIDIAGLGGQGLRLDVVDATSDAPNLTASSVPGHRTS